MLSKSNEETKKIAEDFLKNLSAQKNKTTVVGLYGNLGSGKTTFVQHIAKALGVKKNIQSPTYVIIKNYNLQSTIYNLLIHIDAYRLKNAKEIEKLGWQEIINNPKNLVFVEWPEKITEAMPENEVKINFSFIDETTREIEINS